MNFVDRQYAGRSAHSEQRISRGATKGPVGGHRGTSCRRCVTSTPALEDVPEAHPSSEERRVRLILAMGSFQREAMPPATTADDMDGVDLS